MSKLKQREIRSWSCTRRRAAWFSGRLSGFISGSHTISAHREGNLPALLQSALPLQLSCHCNGLCESPEHQQAQKKKKKRKNTAHTLTHKHTGARTCRLYTAFRHKAPVKGGGNMSSSCLFLSAAADVTDFRARRCMRVHESDVCVCVHECVFVCVCVCDVFVSSAVYHWLNKRLLNINSFPLHLPVYDTYIYTVVQGQRYSTYIYTHSYIYFTFHLPIYLSTPNACASLLTFTIHTCWR